MEIINTDVVYIDEIDLFPHARNKDIDKIKRRDVKDNKLIRESTVVIYRNDREFKVLKSRW